ncbi:MAG: hypothetical protein GWN17_00270 [Candidatus Korarchaeota archaeon]|nr:hypothetical protein [Candidatus Thorarchaeota archaeon]NIW50658.1 hypothetical protein [Candidatus Korarchaeota archaeon]
MTKEEEDRRWREMGGRRPEDRELYKIFLDTGCKKCPKCGSENLKDKNYRYRVDCLDCGWLYIVGAGTDRMPKGWRPPPPPPKPLTEAQKRQIALEKEREKKEAERQWALEEERRKKEAEKMKKEALEKAEKLVKGFTDEELIYKYLEWDELMENVETMGGIPEFEVVDAELKRRGITDETIETRRKEMIKAGQEEHIKSRRREMTGTCKHPKNKGKDCTAESCPYIVNDKGKTYYEWVIYSTGAIAHSGKHHYCQYGERN